MGGGWRADGRRLLRCNDTSLCRGGAVATRRICKRAPLARPAERHRGLARAVSCALERARRLRQRCQLVVVESTNREICVAPEAGATRITLAAHPVSRRHTPAAARTHPRVRCPVVAGP